MFYRFSLYGHAAGTFCIFLNSHCWGRGAPNKASKALITIVIWRNLWASAQRRSITFLQTHKSPSFVTTLSEHGRCWFSSKLRHVGAWFWLLCNSLQAFVIGFRGKVSGSLTQLLLTSTSMSSWKNLTAFDQESNMFQLKWLASLCWIRWMTNVDCKSWQTQSIFWLAEARLIFKGGRDLNKGTKSRYSSAFT